MDILTKMVGPALTKNIITGLMLAMMSATVWMSLYLQRLNENIIIIKESAKTEIVECERRCNLEKDALQAEHRKTLQDFITRLEKQEAKIKRLR